MSGTATIAITVGVAVAVLVGFFIVYYLGNVANSIYDVKVGVRKDFDKKVKELQDWVDKDTKQRINWMREENREEGKRFKETMEGHLEETFNEMEKTIERLRGDVSSLQIQVQALQEGKGGQPAAKMNEPPPFSRPKVKKDAGGLGDLEVAQIGLPETEEAPDLAAPKAKVMPEDGKKEPGKPTPPPPPASAREAQAKPSSGRAGRASVEKKSRKKRKAGQDDFETFNTFSGDFKSGR